MILYKENEIFCLVADQVVINDPFTIRPHFSTAQPETQWKAKIWLQPVLLIIKHKWRREEKLQSVISHRFPQRKREAEGRVSIYRPTAMWETPQRAWKKKENMLTRWKGRLGEPPFYARPDENHGLRGEMGGRRVGVSSWPQTQSLTSGGATAPYCHISARWSTAEVQGRLLRTKHGNMETLSDK